MSAGYVGAGRGVGLVDMVRGHGRASGEIALHVTEIVTALPLSAREGRRIDLRTTPAIPPLVPLTPTEQWRTADG